MTEELCENLAMLCYLPIQPRPAGVTFEAYMDELVKSDWVQGNWIIGQLMAQATNDCECLLITCGPETKSTPDVFMIFCLWATNDCEFLLITCGPETKSTPDVEKLAETVENSTVNLAEESAGKQRVVSLTTSTMKPVLLKLLLFRLWLFWR